MTAPSAQPSGDEPVHVFDQTNGVLGDSPEAEPKRRGAVGGAKGDLPAATHLVIGGF